MKLITANKLNRLWENGIIPALAKKIDIVRILKTMEEVEANTNEDNIVSATVVSELNNKLGGVEFIFDESGKIVGYKTPGGADTVFPFSRNFQITVGLKLTLTNDGATRTLEKTTSLVITCRDGQISYNNPNISSYLFEGTAARSYANIILTSVTYKEL